VPSGVEIVSPPPSPTCHTPTNRDPPGHSHRLEIDKFEVFMTELRQHHGRRPMVSILHKDEELTPADQGDTSLYRKQFKKAFAYYCRALSQCPISSTSNIDSSMLPTISNIGLASFENGEDQCALMFYYRALEGYERIGSRRDIVIVLCRIGDVLYALENSDDAREYYSRAVALYDKMPDIDDIECGEITIVVPKALARLGYYTKAWDIWMRVLSTHKQNNNIIGSSNILNEIALYYHMNKREFKLALELHLRALEGYRSGGGWFAEAGITLDYMGLAFEELGQSENALEHHLQALYIFGNAKSNGYCIQRAKSYARMGDVHRRHANYAEALQNQYSALVEYEKTCSSGNTLREGCIRDIESLFLDLRQQEDHTQIYQNLLDKFQNALGSQHKMIVMAREERDASSARVAINTSYPKSTSLLIPGWDVDCFSRA
jgi:tetratricopeptide (TPR) repeat protein